MNDIYHVIKDPVHGTMQFTTTEDAWVKPFVDSPNFQRLRHIKQLGMGDFIFPGAVHSRFNHSLGCCYVASQISHKIGLAEEERQLVMIACLLHDIGHGPFSHAFEGIFSEKAIRHEDWTPYFLAEYGTNHFFQNYNQLNPRYHFSTDKFNTIADMIMHKPVSKKVLADVVSSQLDADRLDYLLRDSHFCGVQYGEFDFRWMLHCMAIIGSPEGERLGITHKGIGVVEHYLMARRLMTRNIYHSQKKLALETLLIMCLANLAVSLAHFAPYAGLKETRLGAFLLAANLFNQSSNKNKTIFLEDNYTAYKELCDYDIFSAIRYLAELMDDEPATQIAKRLHYRLMPKIIHLDQYNLSVIKAELAAFKNKYHEVFSEWQLMLIETPHQSYSGEEDPILVINERDEVQPISHFSVMINAISDKLEHTVFMAVDQLILQDKRVIEFLSHLQTMAKQTETL